MHLELAPGSRALVDLRSKGIVRALDHEVTLTVPPEPWSLTVQPGDGGIFDFEVIARVQVARFEPSGGIPLGDTARMTDNLRSAEVLDAARWPSIDVRARYEGTLSAGALTGALVVRGAARPWKIALTMEPTERGCRARGAWEGSLGALGIKPYRAALGVVRLEDWMRIRLELELTITT